MLITRIRHSTNHRVGRILQLNATVWIMKSTTANSLFGRGKHRYLHWFERDFLSIAKYEDRLIDMSFMYTLIDNRVCFWLPYSWAILIKLGSRTGYAYFTHASEGSLHSCVMVASSSYRLFYLWTKFGKEILFPLRSPKMTTGWSRHS